MLGTRATVGLVILLMLLASGPMRAQEAPHIGIKVRTLTADLRKQHKRPDDAKGALITAVNSGPAKEKGIVRGDVILEAGGKPVASAKDVANRIAAISASGAGTTALRVMNEKGEHLGAALIMDADQEGLRPWCNGFAISSPCQEP